VFLVNGDMLSFGIDRLLDAVVDDDDDDENHDEDQSPSFVLEGRLLVIQ